ncbi:TPA: hypothetical protein DIS56_01210 [Candidatus Saccharibacteria bacterium]|nr:MAG: hypothetical protein A3F05_00945 [Candidatus Saccharibacteria bacterium RIFCSPHIGHO2_12_FULL_47_17]HCM51732.1 hypothetical protein [Candidatus Saccharibacteria bacterium]
MPSCSAFASSHALGQKIGKGSSSRFAEGEIEFISIASVEGKPRVVLQKAKPLLLGDEGH